MIRLLGAAFLIVGSSALGGHAVLRLSGRVRDIKGLLRGLEAMKHSLLSNIGGLEDMLKEAVNFTQGKPQELFADVCGGMNALDCDSFDHLWQKALDTKRLNCTAADRDELRPLGRILGNYDVDSQAEALDRVIKNLDSRLNDAKDRQSSLGRVYGVLGVSAGLLLTIMLV